MTRQEEKKVVKNTQDCEMGVRRLQEEYSPVKIKKKIRKVKTQVVSFDQTVEHGQLKEECR